MVHVTQPGLHDAGLQLAAKLADLIVKGLRRPWSEEAQGIDSNMGTTLARLASFLAPRDARESEATCLRVRTAARCHARSLLLDMA